MNREVFVRPAKETDFLGATALFSELGGKLPVLTGDDGLQRWNELIHHSGTIVFLAERDGHACGIAVLHILPNMTNAGRPYALIENVVTKSSLRGNGIGRKVMQAAIDYAWDQNAYKIMLMTGKVRKDGGAVGFYENLGFTADEKNAMTMRRVPPRD